MSARLLDPFGRPHPASLLNERGVQAISRVVRLLPPRVRPLLTPWMPNFNLVLRKADGEG